MHERNRVPLMPSRRIARHGRQVEPIRLQRPDQMAREAGVAGISAVRVRFVKAHPRDIERPLRRTRLRVGDRFAMVHADRGHVGVAEHFLLVVADDDQRVQARARDGAAQTRDRRRDGGVPLA